MPLHGIKRKRVEKTDPFTNTTTDDTSKKKIKFGGRTYLADPDMSEFFKPILLIIFDMLNVQDLTRASWVCKEWHELVFSSYWGRVVEQKCGERGREYLQPLITAKKINYREMLPIIPHSLFDFLDQVCTFRLNHDYFYVNEDDTRKEPLSSFSNEDLQVVCTFGLWRFQIVSEGKIKIDHPKHPTRYYENNILFTHIAHDGVGNHIFAFSSSSGLVYQIDYKKVELVGTFETSFSSRNIDAEAKDESPRFPSFEEGSGQNPLRKKNQFIGHVPSFLVKDGYILISYEENLVDIIPYTCAEGETPLRCVSHTESPTVGPIGLTTFENTVLGFGQEKLHWGFLNFFTYDLHSKELGDFYNHIKGPISCFTVADRLFTVNDSGTYYLDCDSYLTKKNEKKGRADNSATVHDEASQKKHYMGQTLSILNLNPPELLKIIPLEDADDEKFYRAIAAYGELIFLYSLLDDQPEQITIFNLRNSSYEHLTDCIDYDANVLTPQVLETILVRIHEEHKAEQIKADTQVE